MNNTPRTDSPINVGHVIIGLVIFILILVSLLSIADAVAHYRMENKIDVMSTWLAPTFTTPQATK